MAAVGMGAAALAVGTKAAVGVTSGAAIKAAGATDTVSIAWGLDLALAIMAAIILITVDTAAMAVIMAIPPWLQSRHRLQFTSSNLLRFPININPGTGIIAATQKAITRISRNA